jgi:vanillate O-demethylase ferredoxin subunit
VTADTERLRLRVDRIGDEAENIRSFELRDPDGATLPPFEAGAHLLVDVAPDLVRQYSLCNDPVEKDRYVIAVQREATGRGGSRAMFETVGIGSVLSVSAPRNHFRLADDATDNLLVAGGIGITPILAMVRTLERANRSWRLHYCARGCERAAFASELSQAPFGDRVSFHFDGGDPRRGLDATALLASHVPGTHLYCCGPAGLMHAVERATAHWPADHVHFERFSGDGTAPIDGADRSFEIEIASSGRVLVVPAGRSILEVLRAHGIEIESLCREGICGTCITGLVAGLPDHRDHVLDAGEKAANDRIALCRSRALSDRLVLDL